MSIGPRHIQVRDAIAAYWAEHRCAPRNVDIEDALSLTRRQAETAIATLVAEGVAVRDGKRTLRLVEATADTTAEVLRKNYASAVRITARQVLDRLSSEARRHGDAETADRLAAWSREVMR